MGPILNSPNIKKPDAPTINEIKDNSIPLDRYLLSLFNNNPTIRNKMYIQPTIKGYRKSIPE